MSNPVHSIEPAANENRPSRSLFLLVVLVVFALVFGFLLFVQLEGYQEASLATRFASPYRIFSEFLLAAGAISILLNGRMWSRLLAYSVFTVFILIYVVQYTAVSMTAAYLSPTAIENFRHVGLIFSTSHFLIVSAAIALILLICIKTEFRFGPASRKKIFAAATGCFLLAAAFELDRFWLDETTQQDRFKLYHFANNYMADSAPVRALAIAISMPWQSGTETRPLSEADRMTAEEFGISYQQDQPYPLIRNGFYRSASPFVKASRSAPLARPLNVIVLMSEGISSRVIQPYSDLYPGLTPNIEDFGRSAMRVDNYYNHTFATYRGLLGQLCSIYPFHGGGFISHKADYYCLGHLFNEEGYDTQFLFSQQKKRTQLDETLSKAGFDSTLAQNDLREMYLDGEKERRYLALSDQQLFDALTAHLRHLEEQQQEADSAPFMLGVYNIETHAWFEMSDDGVNYAAGESYILDAIHNFDNAFGRFWEYFRQSSLFENTVVIFTSDHAHFQGKDFRALVAGQDDYQPYFVDRVPLLIYHPDLKLPEQWDASNASTIDFAPTLAHLMGLRNRPNAFLGRSLFERDSDESLAFGDGNIYLIGPNGISTQSSYEEQAGGDERMNRMYKVIQNIHALESQGRIWNKP